MIICPACKCWINENPCDCDTMPSERAASGPSDGTTCSPSFAVVRRLLAFVIAIPLGPLWGLLFCFFIPLSMAWRCGSEKLTEDGDWFLGLLAKPLRKIRGANETSPSVDATEKPMP